jgi:hypothetical protein
MKRPPFHAPLVAVAIALVACGSDPQEVGVNDEQARTGPEADGSTPDSSDKTGPGDSATKDGGTPDTCPLASGPFELNPAPPKPGSNTMRGHVALAVPANGPAMVYTQDYFSNGSFYEANLTRLTRSGSGWKEEQVAKEEYGYSIASGLAATGGSDPCVAYTDDYDQNLHVRCSSLPDRVVAPFDNGSVAMAEVTSGPKQLVYTNSGTLYWVSVTPDPAPEIIGSAGPFAPSMVVDAAGVPHVAFRDGDGPGISYATRVGNTWAIEKVDDDVDIGSLAHLHQALVSLRLVGGKPVIAYQHRGTRSMRLAVKSGSTFTVSTLDAPPVSGSEDDLIGEGVALQVDCMDRLHVVYHRNVATDPTPNVNLFYARIVDGKITDRQALPLATTSTLSASRRASSLAFVVGKDGRQYVAAELSGISGLALSYATR